MPRKANRPLHPPSLDFFFISRTGRGEVDRLGDAVNAFKLKL